MPVGKAWEHRAGVDAAQCRLRPSVVRPTILCSQAALREETTLLLDEIQQDLASRQRELARLLDEDTVHTVESKLR